MGYNLLTICDVGLAWGQIGFKTLVLPLVFARYRPPKLIAFFVWDSSPIHRLSICDVGMGWGYMGFSALVLPLVSARQASQITFFVSDASPIQSYKGRKCNHTHGTPLNTFFPRQKM